MSGLLVVASTFEAGMAFKHDQLEPSVPVVLPRASAVRGRRPEKVYLVGPWAPELDDAEAYLRGCGAEVERVYG